jgi:hypothetical protein
VKQLAGNEQREHDRVTTAHGAPQHDESTRPFVVTVLSGAAVPRLTALTGGAPFVDNPGLAS